MGFGVRRGDFRFLVLMALSEKPMHGYALIQEIGRTYLRPVSAGLIYPTLQELEDMGYVSSEEKGGKKTSTGGYTILGTPAVNVKKGTRISSYKSMELP
jgi:DNA-binding PadR family transcriptional regulator